MSITDIATQGWRLFWSNILAPASLGLFAAILIGCLLAGFAFRRTLSALSFALRAGASLLAAILLIGFLGVLGVNMNGLTPLVNWLLGIVQAPLYLPGAVL